MWNLGKPGQLFWPKLADFWNYSLNLHNNFSNLAKNWNRNLYPSLGISSKTKNQKKWESYATSWNMKARFDTLQIWQLSISAIKFWILVFGEETTCMEKVVFKKYQNSLSSQLTSLIDWELLVFLLWESKLKANGCWYWFWWGSRKFLSLWWEAKSKKKR